MARILNGTADACLLLETFTLRQVETLKEMRRPNRQPKCRVPSPRNIASSPKKRLGPKMSRHIICSFGREVVKKCLQGQGSYATAGMECCKTPQFQRESS